jgi:hypothetical protein
MATGTTYTTNVARELMPALQQNTARMIGIANRPYQAYQGQRVADWDPMSQHAYQNAWGVGANTNAGYGDAADMTRMGIAGAMNTPMWGSEAASRYMDPYQQNVTDIAKNSAVQDKLRNDQLMNSSLVSKGAFGGSRHGIMAADANRTLATNLNNIQMQGLSSAYGNAQQQFNADRGAYNTGINTAMQGAQNYGNLYGAQQSSDMARNDYMNQYGLQGQKYNQTMMDIGYSDWQNAQNNDRNNATWLNEQLHSSGATTTTREPAPNVASQLFGTGLAAYGAYKEGTK